MTSWATAEPLDWRQFDLPDELSASEPPEARGVARDEVKLLVAAPDGVRHGRFSDLARRLRPGDLLVANDSATIPAAVDGWRSSCGPVTVHFSTPLPDRAWLVELRLDGRPVRDGSAGERLQLPFDTTLVLREPWPPGTAAGASRLWHATVMPGVDVLSYLRRAGRPVTYAHVRERWPLDSYQTIFARTPGSAEMPSAGRPFTARVLEDLAAAGVGVATLTLHTGVSSLEEGELPLPERFAVPEKTAAAVARARTAGGRVVAVGTTATRALETVADDGGHVVAGRGWTDLVLGPHRGARVVDGLITGWHEPRSSHLSLVEAVVGTDVAAAAYAAAVEYGYLWHEFGDSALLLRETR